MRVRKKKNLGKRLENCREHIVYEDEISPGSWLPEGFTQLELEIGSGKGRFITTLALQNPNIFYVALEREADVLVMAAEKAKAIGLKNLRFIVADAEHLAEMFKKGEVSAIYINFCDPWPAGRQAKRRLTHRRHLIVYRSILSGAGRIFFKSDSEALYEFTLTELRESGFEIDFKSRDLHNDHPDGIMTEYEERFSLQGMLIYAIDATMSAEPQDPSVENK